MEVNHIENLQKICRLCGKLDFNNLKLFNFTRNKTDFKKIIRDDDSDKAIFPPKKFCYDCRTNFLSPLNTVVVKKGDRSKIDEILQKFEVFEFCEHSENCQICQQFPKPNEIHTQITANADVDGPEAGAQESDLDENGANVEASFAFHVQCLKEICSLCGVREKANTGLRAYQFERVENEEELLNMLKQNRNALYPQPKKDKFCGKCRYGVLSELDKARKGKNSFNDAQESLLEKLHIFKQHKEHDCDICSQFSQKEISFFNQKQKQVDNQPSQHSNDNDSFEDCEEQELVNLGLSDSGDNMDDCIFGLSTPNKRNRSQISDSSTEECLPTTPRPRGPYTPKKMNIGEQIQSSPTVYDKVSDKIIFINNYLTHNVCFCLDKDNT